MENLDLQSPGLIMAAVFLALTVGAFMHRAGWVWQTIPLAGVQARLARVCQSNLSKGRETCIQLCASHLLALNVSGPVWLDLGGRAAENLALMNSCIPISSFGAVYVVRRSEAEMGNARSLCRSRSWKNVYFVCGDPSEFHVPDQTPANLVTLSYALSTAPNFHALIDRADSLLSSNQGILSVVDFYTAKHQVSLHKRAIGGSHRTTSFVGCWTWRVCLGLSSCQREYLEHRFGMIKNYNERSPRVLPFGVRIPFYVWIGRSRRCDTTAAMYHFEIQGGNRIGSSSPALPSTPIVQHEKLNPRDTIIEIPEPMSPFHYHLTTPRRLPYYDQEVHKEFRTYMYAFTWEDPFEDMKYLDLGPEDSMFVITSAGDNALHYAIAAQPKRIHCVDMNPYQGHLMELKLAALQTLPYAEFFAMFGQGRHPDFPTLLETKFAPLLSNGAFEFWKRNSESFSSAFYLQGYSGWALGIAQNIFKFAGVSDDVKALCDSDTIAEQTRIWKERLRPAFLNRVVVALMRSPLFCWYALGVPLNQRRMLFEEGPFYEFIRDSYDPIPETYSLKNGSYFYLLALLGHYTSESCPQYLTQEGFEALRKDNASALDALLLHTDTIIEVLKGIQTGSITRAIIMDHMDWFDPGAVEVDEEINELHRALAPGGTVLWRSASRRPWYRETFEQRGFTVTALAVREGPQRPIDQVNMYASFFRAVRM